MLASNCILCIIINNYYYLQALPMATFLGYTTSDGEKITIVPVLECGEVIDYTIPSFSVITVKLRKMKYQCNVSDEAGNSVFKIADGFIKDDPSLNRSYPAEVVVGSSDDSACLIEASHYLCT